MDAPLVPLLVAAGAALAAGFVNAVAGGGTLITFPTLLWLGVPAVPANVTNTVALCPGYLGGALAQRRDLARYRSRLAAVLGAGGLGGLAGAALLVVTPERLFRNAVPYLILLACAALGLQDALKRRLRLDAAASGGEGARWLPAAVFAAAVYGGYFGAGLGVMLLAVLGLAIHDALNRLNALKQALSTVINVIAALFFVASGQVRWDLAAVMAGAALVGGHVGGRVAGRLDPRVLRWVVITIGVALAGRYLAT